MVTPTSEGLEADALEVAGVSEICLEADALEKAGGTGIDLRGKNTEAALDLV